MKYGLFSDVHGNLEAFQVVLDSMRDESIDRFIFLGDIVGYGADPSACLALLKNLIDVKGCQCLAGNHDYAVCSKTSLENFNSIARQSIEWTRSQLNQESMLFLSSLPLTVQAEGFSAVHANFLAPDAWGYILDVDDAFSNFCVLKDSLGFIAHSHRPLVFSHHADRGVDWQLMEHCPLRSGYQYIINIGSVGQPRDGDPRACYALYDDEKKVVDIKRVDYNIKAAQAKILTAGLPLLCAQRLQEGK